MTPLELLRKSGEAMTAVLRASNTPAGPSRLEWMQLETCQKAIESHLELQARRQADAFNGLRQVVRDTPEAPRAVKPVEYIGRVSLPPGDRE